MHPMIYWKKNDEISRIENELEEKESELDSKNKDIGFVTEALNQTRDNLKKSQTEIEE